MGGAPKAPPPDPELERQRQKIAEENARKLEEDKRRKDEEEAATLARLRGRRALLSSAGGELGFADNLGG